MVLNMLRQLPQITKAAFAEKKKMKQIITTYNIDYIISDNRFGCYDSKIPSFFITHQLNLKIDNFIAQFLGNAANRFWLKKYNEIWVPDFENVPNISGNLSHPPIFKNIKYIGTLTRMKPLNVPIQYKIIVVLSGPEPQRSILEEKIILQIKNIQGKVLIVKGKTEEKKSYTIHQNINVISYLTSQELNKAICASEIIITRSGYSTLMDLSVLNKKAILIPTPGQTEQEYLAKHFHQQKKYVMQYQNNINIESALELLHHWDEKKIEYPHFSLKDFLQKKISISS